MTDQLDTTEVIDDAEAILLTHWHQHLAHERRALRELQREAQDEGAAT